MNSENISIDAKPTNQRDCEPLSITARMINAAKDSQCVTFVRRSTAYTADGHYKAGITDINPSEDELADKIFFDFIDTNVASLHIDFGSEEGK